MFHHQVSHFHRCVEDFLVEPVDLNDQVAHFQTYAVGVSVVVLLQVGVRRGGEVVSLLQDDMVLAHTSGDDGTMNDNKCRRIQLPL